MTMTTTLNATNTNVNTGLTKLDISAMRKADDNVCFFYNEDQNTDERKQHKFAETGGTIVLHKTNKSYGKSAFEERTTAHEIAVKTHFVGYKNSDGETLKNRAKKCFAMLIYPNSCDSLWNIVSKVAKVGDQLTLEWIANNDNNYIRDTANNVKLNVDHLYLIIKRKGKTYGRFLLNTSICPNNSARMIQY